MTAAAPVPGTGHRRYLIVRLGGREFAVPAGVLRGTALLRGLAPQAVEGRGALRFIAIWRGRGIPVYLPHAKLGLVERPVSARTCVLLVNRGGEAEPDCALIADSVSRLEEIPPARRRQATGGPERVWAQGKWKTVLEVRFLCAE
jgi:chemotaxis signal transduction protein